MASANEFHIKSYVATDAIAAYVLVKKDGTTDNVVIAGAGDAAIGVTMTNAAAGTVVPVRLLNGYGTALVKAGGAVTKNSVVRGIASGKIDDATTGCVIGIADEDASADGDVIEVLLTGSVPVAQVASANQAVPTDLATTIAFCTSVRTALINNGIIKGAA